MLGDENENKIRRKCERTVETGTGEEREWWRKGQ